MHNCKLTRTGFVDLVLDEIPAPRSSQLLAELNECPSCQAEYAALKSALHVSSRALRSTLPGEEFWSGYRARLHSKLLAVPDGFENGPAPDFSSKASGSLGSQLWLALRTMTTASVRVPVPAALAVLLLFGAFFLVMRSLAQTKTSSVTPVVFAEPKTVEVPVIQQKVITRVVYLEKKVRRSGKGANQSATPVGDNSGSNAATRTALNLTGFKPTDEVKLTIIKGGNKNQK